MPTYFSGKGDDGTTGLLGEGRVKKYDLRMEALGTLDELSACLGIARSISKEYKDVLKRVQVHLYEMMAEIAATSEKQLNYRKIDTARIEFLEKTIEQVSGTMEKPDGFILPGDTQAAGAISLARAVCRRAERRVVELFDAKIIENESIRAYLNRLSSLLFVVEVSEAVSEMGAPTEVKRQIQ